MFKKNDGRHFLVHSHNEDVPWFHIKAVTGQGAEVDLIRSNDSSRNIGMAPPIYGKELQSVPPKLFESSTSGINNTMSSIVGQTLQSNIQPNIKHSIPMVVLARGMSFNQNELPYIMDNKGQFNMDIWFKRLSKDSSETFWSLFPRVACSYSTGSHGSETDDETVAQEIYRRGKICVVVLAYFDFTGNSSTDFAKEFLTPSIIFETDNKNNDPIGGRPRNSRAHVDDYANIANLIGISPKELNLSGNRTFRAGELLCSTLNKNKTFAPNNVGGYYVPHNLAQFVLCSETYQYVAHLEAYVYNSYNGNNFKAVFPIQSKQRPMPGKREPWDMENIYDQGNNRNIQSAKKFMTDVYTSMFNLINAVGLPQDQYSMFGRTGNIGEKSSFAMTLLRAIKKEQSGKNYLKILKDKYDSILESVKRKYKPNERQYVNGINFETLKEYNDDYHLHYNNQGLSPVLLQMFFNALDEGNKQYLDKNDWSRIP